MYEPSYVTFLITEPGWTHQTKCCHTLSGRLPACGDAPALGRKPRVTPLVRPAHPTTVTFTTAACKAKTAAGARARGGKGRTKTQSCSSWRVRELCKVALDDP